MPPALPSRSPDESEYYQLTMSLRTRAVGVGLLLVAVLAGLGLWLARDLPRRQVERALSHRLQGEVRVGRLTIDALDRAVLERLEVRRIAALPQLESLTIARVDATGPLRELARGQCGVLRLEGLELVLAPDPARPTIGGAALTADVLEVPGAKVTLRAGDERATFALDATLRDLGGALTGEVRIAGPRLNLATLGAFAGAAERPAAGMVVEGVAATAVLEPGGGARLSAAAEAVTIRRGDRQVTLDRPRVEAHATVTEGRVLVTVVPALTGLGSARAELVIALHPLRLEQIDARASALELGHWLPPLPGNARLAGLAEITVDGSPSSGLRSRVVVERAVLETPAAALAGSVRVSGTLILAGGSLRGPVEAAVELGPGTSGWPALLLPARLAASGEASVGARSQLAGRFEVTTATAGTATVEGTAAITDQMALDLAWRWQGGDATRLAELATAIGAVAPPAGCTLDGALAARGTVSGTLQAAAATAEVTLDQARAGPADGEESWSVLVPRARVGLAWKPTTRLLEASLPATAVAVHFPPLEPLELQLSADGTLDPAARFVRLGRLELEAPGIGGAHATASGGRAAPASVELHLELADVEQARRALRPLVDAAPDDVTLAGSASADLAVTLTAASAWSAAGPITLRQAGFTSIDGARVAEGVSGAFELRADGTATALHARATGEAGGFQMLWGTLFGDWSQTRFGVELDLDAARSAAAPNWSWQAGAALTSPGGLRARATVDQAPGHPLGWTAELAADDLAAVLESSLQGPLAGAHPLLASMAASGSAAARFEGTLGQQAGTARGSVRLSGVDLRVPPLEVQGLDAELPTDLAWWRPDPASPLSVSGPRLQGSLRLARAAAGGLTVPATSTGLVVEADRVTLDQGLAVPLFGGEVELEELALADLLRPTRHLATSVELRKISLAEASRLLGLPPLEGSLDGAFPRVRLTPTTLRVDGAGQLALFGGTVEVNAISGQDVLGRYPRLIFDARLADIDLAQLTRTFDFGRVTGILAGEVTGCELFRGLPVRFVGTLHTVEMPGVPQRISLKAVNNIAIVGTGSGITGLGTGLVGRFVSSYAYQAFGVSMVLDEDRFLLRGLERRGDRELFLRGTSPFRLDVVNVDPGTTVSFRTMVDRLRNLDFSAVQTQP